MSEPLLSVRNLAVDFTTYGRVNNVLRGVSLMLLPYSGFGMASLTAFAIFNGVEWVATVPPIVKLLIEVFGKREAPVLVAWVYALHQVGSAAAAMGGGGEGAEF